MDLKSLTSQLLPESELWAALPLLGFSPQIWGFSTRPRVLGFSWGFSKNLGFFWVFFRFPRKIHILECFVLERRWFFVIKGKKCKNHGSWLKKGHQKFLREKVTFLRKSSTFPRKSSIFSQNLYTFDLGFSGVFFSGPSRVFDFLEWQH